MARKRNNWPIIFHPKPCKVCGKDFQPKSSVHVFCSEKCKGRIKYVTGEGSTENQYKRISRNWRRYLQRLLYGKGRESLSVEDLLTLLEKQNGKCALTGSDLTCELGLGMIHMTNVSIDRIRPGGPYSLDNIRLVCRIANVMKWNMSDQELKEWCKKIISYGQT